MNKNIVLIGFMGSGKSMIADALSGRLKRESVSTDRLIEHREGQSIAGIFEKKGEAYFRALEHTVIKEISNRRDIIIDCGGGVVLTQENLKLLKTHGIVFHLQASPEVIFERIKIRSVTGPCYRCPTPSGHSSCFINKDSPCTIRPTISLMPMMRLLKARLPKSFRKISMTEQEALLVLNAVPDLGALRIRKFVAFFGSALEVLQASFDELHTSGILLPETAENIFHFSKDKFLQDEYNLMQRKGIVVVTAVDDNYPCSLKDFEDAPVVLYIKGEVDCLKSNVSGYS